MSATRSQRCARGLAFAAATVEALPLFVEKQNPSPLRLVRVPGDHRPDEHDVPIQVVGSPGRLLVVE